MRLRRKALILFFAAMGLPASRGAAADALSGNPLGSRREKALVLETIAVDGAANYGTWDGSHYWVGSFGGQKVTELGADGRLLKVYPLGAGTAPLQLAFDGKDIWVASADPLDHLIRLDPATGKTSVYALAPKGDGGLGGLQCVLWDGKNIWAALAGLNQVVEVDPKTGAIVARAGGQTNVNGLAYVRSPGPGGRGTREHIWAADSNSIGKIDAKTMACASYGKGEGLFRLVAARGYVYAAETSHGLVYKFDEKSGALVAVWPTGRCPNDIAFDGRYIWTVSDDNYISIHDRDSGRLVARIPDSGKSSLTYDGKYMWSVNDAKALVYKVFFGAPPKGPPSTPAP
ncbi:MAG TPA: hypothetical protein VK914_13075 [bacterium]|nr:hypothetical protein [bacterium]